MSLADIIDVVRPAVVQVAVNRWKSDGSDFSSHPIGTGFIVDREAHVVTAQHVASAARAAATELAGEEHRIAIGLAYPNTESRRGHFNMDSYEVIEEDTLHDLALLKRRHNPFVRGVHRKVEDGIPIEPQYGVASIRAARPRDGDAIAISGYPLGGPTLVTTTGTVASSWAVNGDRAVIPGVMPHNVYLADIRANPGNSGGPAYSAVDGAVVGVLVAGKLAPVASGGQGLSIVVPASYVVEMLDRNGVAWTRAK